jgi:hypothetical protein
MAVVPYGQSLYYPAAGITLTGFNVGIASGALVTSQQIAAQLLSGATGSYEYTADLVLTLGTAETMGAGSPNFQANALISLVSGGASETARVSSSQLFPFVNFAQEPLVPSGAYTATELIVVKGIRIPASPYFAIGFLNNSGIAMPTTLVATLYPSGSASG